MIEEGDLCPVDDCEGMLKYAKEGNCSCHISPPCANCLDTPLVCLKCGFEIVDDETEMTLDEEINNLLTKGSGAI